MEKKDLIVLLKTLKGKKLVDIILSDDHNPNTCWGLLFKENTFSKKMVGFKYTPNTKKLELCEFGFKK